MSRIDLTLPEKVPEMAEYQHKECPFNPFALYSLVECTEMRQDLLKASNSECPDDDYVKLAPQMSVLSGSLKEVIAYYIKLVAEEDNLNYRYFLVVTTEDWRRKGIAMVTLDDDELECRPDPFFCQD
ncbi:hypothetical protein AAFC00_000816 [Neodothiora populina]|uniref:Uncharacterized protein n=1 Tax=Neodothiora populina TaxID=2781224 RepID=A0ABR3PLU1_9PEZI